MAAASCATLRNKARMLPQQNRIVFRYFVRRCQECSQLT